MILIEDYFFQHKPGLNFNFFERYITMTGNKLSIYKNKFNSKCY